MLALEALLIVCPEPRWPEALGTGVATGPLALLLLAIARRAGRRPPRRTDPAPAS